MMICSLCRKEVEPGSPVVGHTFYNGDERWWHALCYERVERTILPVPRVSALKMYEHIKNLSEVEDWMLDFLAVFETSERNRQ